MTQRVLIENVGIPLTAFVCSRSNSTPRLKTRKFKAPCGSYLTFFHDGKGKIDHAELEFNNCNVGCPACEEQYKKAKNLIENNK